MPACLDCKMRNGTNCLSHTKALEELKRPLPPPPTGACTIAIVESYFQYIKPNMKVLEIGCGTWPKVKDQCIKVGAHFEGLDVKEEYYGTPCIATRYENLADLSFQNDEFDVVVGNQTMEHWAEFGCDTIWGLYQCFRVLKPGGRLLLNVPIHFHGTKNFVHGRIDKILQLFKPFSNQVHIEKWGHPTAPLPEFYPHPGFSALKYKPAYVLDIIAIKDKPLPKNMNNFWGLSGWPSRLVHYSFMYNLYRLKNKVQSWIKLS